MLNLVCSQCVSVNRVPPSKTYNKPLCGKCKTHLLPNYPVELTDASFAKFIQRTDVPVLVDFWATWCGPCRMMAPAFKEAAAQLSPRFILAKLDTDAAPQTSAQFSITSIPTLVLYKNGVEVAQRAGVHDAQQIARFVAQWPT
ncbi:MAG: thioredoxin [Pirellulaceae bacterium]